MSLYKKLDKSLVISTYILLLIPTVLFFSFWCKWYIAIPSIVIVIFLIHQAIKHFSYKTEKEYKEIFNVKRWIVIIALLLLLNVLSGSGGIMYQNWDYNARNAVLHDLIDYDWPVKYRYDEDDLIYNIVGENGRLSYYFSYWLPSALIGKVTNFNVASFASFIYQFFLLGLFYFLLSRLFNKNSIWFLVVVCCFSGLDIIGTYILNPTYDFSLGNHIDTWGAPFAYSSNITQLFWVFNQALPSWIITLLFLNAKNFKNIGLLIVLSLIFSPFPTIGLCLIILYFLILGFKKGNLFERIKEALNFRNFLAIIPFIFIALFYLNNASSQPKGIILSSGVGIKQMIIAMLLEFGLISILCINKKNWKYVIANSICLFLCSQFYLGIGNDFVNRTTIPLLLVLLIMVIDNLKENNKIRNNLIVIYLTLASITPLNEFYRTIVFYNNYGLLAEKNYNDNWKTYGKTINAEAMQIYIRNFSSPYKDNFLNRYIYK